MKVALLLCLTALAALPCSGSPGQTRIDRSLSIEVKDGLFDANLSNIDVKTALADLFKISGKTYRIDWDVEGTIKNIHVQADEFETLLQRILREARATYEIHGGSYRVRTNNGDSPPPTRIERNYVIDGSRRSLYEMRVEWADVQEVLGDLSLVSGVPITVDSGVKGKVSIRVTSTRFETVLGAVVGQVKASYRPEGKGFVVSAR
jgi:type II secretory pathway component GspD/PulD (secretin)